MNLHLNLAQIGLHLDSQRQNSHHFVSSRAALKKGLDVNVVENCLDSLDVFRDLLEGIPHQKNRVVRDVCKNIEVLHFQQGDVIYDIGEKAKAVYFCLAGQVSISIVKQIAVTQDQKTQQNSYRGNDKLNTPKTIQNLSSLTISLTSTSISQQQQIQKIEQEIDVIQSGQGFGQAQFISQTTRTVKATAKLPSTTIGKLELNHFTEVLQNYKQRVYYKKRDMFQKCPLFADLPINKLEFIINNTKPMTINISHQLVKEGYPVDTVYLVNKGQVSIWKTGIEIGEEDMEEEDYSSINKSVLVNSKSVAIQRNSSLGSIDNLNGEQAENQADNSISLQKQKQKQSNNKVFSSLLKIKQSKHPIPLEKHSKVFMGLLSEGSFLGDMELAMGTPFKFNAVCRTEKAEVYYCDRRIILSQMTEENIEEACKSYREKQFYINQKINKYRSAKQKIQRQKQIDLLPPLTKAQINLKRKLMHRHVQERPSLIGHCSPRDIQKMIQRKQKRVIKQPEVSKYPILELFPNHSVKKRSISPTAPSSFNPLSVVQTQGKKCITQFDEYDKKNQQAENPELKRSEQFKKFKSMFIQIKPTKISLNDVKYGSHQENMAVVGKILGRYRRCQSRLKSLSQVIDKIEKSRK